MSIIESSTNKPSIFFLEIMFLPVLTEVTATHFHHNSPKQTTVFVHPNTSHTILVQLLHKPKLPNYFRLSESLSERLFYTLRCRSTDDTAFTMNSSENWMPAAATGRLDAMIVIAFRRLVSIEEHSYSISTALRHGIGVSMCSSSTYRTSYVSGLGQCTETIDRRHKYAGSFRIS